MHTLIATMTLLAIVANVSFALHFLSDVEVSAKARS